MRLTLRTLMAWIDRVLPRIDVEGHDRDPVGGAA